MGFEPTTFCWQACRAFGRKSAGNRRVKPNREFCAPSMLRADSRDLRSIQWGLGIAALVVPNQARPRSE
jgi:hypothetical protein